MIRAWDCGRIAISGVNPCYDKILIMFPIILQSVFGWIKTEELFLPNLNCYLDIRQPKQWTYLLKCLYSRLLYFMDTTCVYYNDIQIWKRFFLNEIQIHVVKSGINHFFDSKKISKSNLKLKQIKIFPKIFFTGEQNQWAKQALDPFSNTFVQMRRNWCKKHLKQLALLFCTSTEKRYIITEES